MNKIHLYLNFDNREKIEGISLRYDATELEENTCLKCVTAYDNAYIAFKKTQNEFNKNPMSFILYCDIEFTNAEFDCLQKMVQKFNLNIL